MWFGALPTQESPPLSGQPRAIYARQVPPIHLTLQRSLHNLVRRRPSQVFEGRPPVLGYRVEHRVRVDLEPGWLRLGPRIDPYDPQALYSHSARHRRRSPARMDFLPLGPLQHPHWPRQPSLPNIRACMTNPPTQSVTAQPRTRGSAPPHAQDDLGLRRLLRFAHLALTRTVWGNPTPQP